MKHVAVTGGAGYIGCVLVAELVNAGYRVSVFDRFFFGEDLLKEFHSNPNFKQKKVDIRDLRPQDFDGVDVVCDLAALSNDPSGDLDPQLTESINFTGRVHVAKCARDAGVHKYILSSTCSVYGHGDSESLDEKQAPSPLTTYSKMSLKAEQQTQLLMSDDFTWTAVRNGTVFGLSPRMRFDLVVNLMTLNAVQKGKIYILGGGKQWRPLVHVRDVSRALIRIIEAPREAIHGEIFNVGLGNYRVLSLAYIVREALPFPVEIEIAPDDADKRNYHVSFEKLHTKLKFTPTITVAEGVGEIYQAMKEGRLSQGPESSTVGWYRTIVEAQRLVDRVILDGRLL